MSNQGLMWLCAAGFLVATVLGVREVLSVAMPSWKLILGPVGTGSMMLFAVVEAMRGKDDAKLKSISLALVAIGASIAVGRAFL